MLFLEYPKCSTSNRAKKWLNDHKISYTTRNIKENNPKYEELKEWYEKSGLEIKKFFNTSGILYREQNIKEKFDQASIDELLTILSTDGMMVKRPIIITDDYILVGFNEVKWSKTILE
jgi:arsenate reductase